MTVIVPGMRSLIITDSLELPLRDIPFSRIGTIGCCVLPSPQQQLPEPLTNDGANKDFELDGGTPGGGEQDFVCIHTINLIVCYTMHRESAQIHDCPVPQNGPQRYTSYSQERPSSFLQAG